MTHIGGWPNGGCYYPFLKNGKMVDVPVAVRAERLLARHREIVAKGERTV